MVQDAVPQLLECVEVPATREPTAGTVIWLHGLGADGHDFEPIVPMLRLPDIRFVFPAAPAIPVTINMGFVMPAWYDILTLDQSDSRENLDHVRTSAQRVVAVLDHERARGTAADRIVLAGFSQGGAMALYVGNRYAEALAGIMVLSGYDVAPATPEAERSAANQSTPALFAHGVHDPLVPIARGRAAHDAMRESAHDERDVRWHEFPMEHEVCPPQIEVIAAWLRERLPARGD